MVYGNYEDKYNTKNPISKILVTNFLKTLKSNLKKINASTIVELGAGEGELLRILRKIFPEASISGSDISEDMMKKAEKALKGKNINLSVEDIHKLSYKSKKFDLVVCAEVIEHVDDPEKALSEIKRICKGRVLLSVPLEPLWRILNMARGKYISDLGNTPGHLNHFTPGQFHALVERSGFKILSKYYPLPWQMVLVEPKK